MATKKQKQTIEEKKDALVERISVKNSPFIIIKYDKEYFLTMGKYRLHNEALKSAQECLTFLEDNKWNIVGILVSIMVEEIKK